MFRLMRELDPTSWHCKLYVQAYINDREWLLDKHVGDNGLEDKFDRESEPYLAYVAQRRMVYGNSKATEQDWAKYNELKQAWHEYEIKPRREANLARGEELRERVNSGRMSLCPYAWSVAWALLRYKLAPKLAGPAEAFAGCVGAALLVAILGFFVYVGYYVREELIAAPGAIVSGIAAVPGNISGAITDWREENKREAEWKLLKQQEEQRQQLLQAAYDLEHPEEVQARQVEARRAADLNRHDRNMLFVVMGAILLFLTVVFSVITVVEARKSQLEAFMDSVERKVFGLIRGLFAFLFAPVISFYRRPSIEGRIKAFGKTFVETCELGFIVLRVWYRQEACPFLKVKGDVKF